MLVERSGVDLASWTWLGHLVRELRAQATAPPLYIC